jgi:tetratricopeptide (TPR) repeat protein
MRATTLLRIGAILAICLGLGVVAVLRPTPANPLDAGDRLFLAGRYHEARAAYIGVAELPDSPALAYARLGMVETVRSEQTAALTAFTIAFQRGLAGDDYELARLYQGALATRDSALGEPSERWALIQPGSRWEAQRYSLEGNEHLRNGRYAEAEQSFRTALVKTIPSSWAAIAHTKLALLRASSDPVRARAELALARAAQSTPAGPQLSDALLPDIIGLIAQLDSALTTEGDRQSQLLGQIYLDHELLGLAEARFRTIHPEGPLGLPAAAYLAYIRWRTGDHAGGIAQLQTLVEQHPDETRVRALLALVALSADEQETGQAQLERLRRAAPNDPATHLAWAHWHTLQRDYLAAAEEYRMAQERAGIATRPAYALAAARFHLDASLRVCEAGLPAAQAAASADPTAEALTVLAQAKLFCGEPEGARDDAERAIKANPQSPGAYYQLGRTLASLGDREGARAALIRTADLAPASPWRPRAEEQLRALGL